MTYCFRIRFVLPDRVTIGADVLEVQLLGPENEDVVLRAPLPKDAPELTITQSKHLSVLGRGYATEPDARRDTLASNASTRVRADEYRRRFRQAVKAKRHI
jgi:hypothetical protein